MDLQQALSTTAAQVHTWLAENLPPVVGDAGSQQVCAAMHYSALAGGKRVRPFVMLEAYQLLGGTDTAAALRVACAIEAVHTFSLIHDDLPCIDNDDLRRGKPTCHKQFTEATAVLAGDALLNWAHGVLADKSTHANAEVRCALIQALSRATHTMIAGEMWDVLAEQGGTAVTTEAELLAMQAMKTGAMFGVCVESAALLAGAEGAHVAALHTYTVKLGLAFQMMDDVLDVTGTAAQLGKTPGKDAASGKLTYTSLLGVAATQARAEALVAEAKAAVQLFGTATARLTQLADFVIGRTG
ncbi:MAG: polyprenyl synthetase family protein [Alphaproteobacteria bacterium]